MASGIEARRQAAGEKGKEKYVTRRRELAQAAAHVFRDQGREATLGDIAQALGTERASLYYYFGSKDELLEEIVRESLARDMATAHTIRRSTDSAPDKIRALIRSMVSCYVDYYPFINVYHDDLGRIARSDSEWAIDIMQETRQYEASVRSILKQGQDEGTFRDDVSVSVAALALFGTVNWMYRWYRPNHPIPPDEIADGFAKIFLKGFATEGTDGPTGGSAASQTSRPVDESVPPRKHPSKANGAARTPRKATKKTPSRPSER